MKGYGASVEWYWHGLVRYPERNFCQCHFVHQESHMDCPGSEARPLRSEAGYHTAGGGLVTTDSCHMTDPFPSGFIRNLFMHKELAESQCVFVSPLGELKDTATALAGIPTADGHLWDLSINLSGLFGEIHNCNFLCCLIWAWTFVSDTVGGIGCRGRYFDLTKRNGEDCIMRKFMICIHQISQAWSN